nr:hypothetical protein [uncultured Rhodopila sp.]
MSAITFDDQFHDDPDLDFISDSAAILHVCGIAYCARNLTDGLIPKPRVLKLKGGTEQSAKELVSIGWWLDCGDYYSIRSFLKYNYSKEDVIKRREKTKERVTRFRNGGMKSNCNDVGNTLCNADVTALQPRYKRYSNAVGNAPCNAPVTRSVTVTESVSESESETESVNINKGDSHITLHAHSDERESGVEEVSSKPAKDTKHAKAEKPQCKIIPPKREWFSGYFAELGYPDYADECFDYWESVGWKRQGRLMVDWQATVRQRVKAIENGSVPVHGTNGNGNGNGRKGPYDMSLQETVEDIQRTRDRLRGITQ